MTNSRDINRQTANSSQRKGKPKFITRRGIVVGGTSLVGLAAAGIAGTKQGNAQQPPTNTERDRTVTGKLNGKVAVITGAARGIGRATAVTLAREGADIVAIDIGDPNALKSSIGYPLATSEDLAETERQVKAMSRRCLSIKADVRNMGQMRQAVERAIAELGKVDILVANAGVLPRVPLLEVTDELWSDTIGVNLTGVGNAIRAIAPHMIERGQGGRIVAVSSVHGRMGAAPFHVYTATKWGVIGLVKSVALELSEHLITVNAVAPGFTRTGMTQNAEVYGRLRSDLASPSPEDIIPVIINSQKEQNLLPIGLIEPEDIASGILYFVSDEARYVTGVVLDITAGENAHYTA